MKKLSLFIVMITFIGYYAAIGQQWANNGNHIYNTNTQNVGIGTGTSFTPTDKLHINNGSNTAGIMAESSYTGASMKALGYFRIKNTATGDMFNMVLRKNGDNHEMLQSCYDATSSLWREYAYFNYTTRKYEMRVGVNDAEFLNAGNILFNNNGTVGIGTTTPSPSNNNLGQCVGVYARADGNVYPNSCGVVGHHFYGGIGVGAWSYTGDLIRAYSGDFPGGTLRFYVNNSGAVYADGYKVFLTPVSEEMVLLTVTGKSPDKFIVKGTTLDGRPASCSFDYRIMAKDHEKRNARMEIVNIPDPVIVPRKD